MLKLAINAVSLAPGGGLNGLLGYLQAWRDIDAPLDITLYASRRKVLDDVRAVRPDVRIVPFALESGSGRHFLAQQWRLGPQIERDGADVLMTTQSGVGRCRVPQLVHHRNLKRFLHLGTWPRLRTLASGETLKDIAARRALRKAARNAFISDYLRRAAESCCARSAARNYVVYNGLSRELLDEARRDGPPWDGGRRLMAITSLAAHKDNPTLIRTLARLVRREPAAGWRLRIAGAGDWSPVRDLARREGVLDRIEFLGYLSHDEMTPYLRKAACLVFTSVLEGFGNPPLEAMARRCPVVTSDCTAIPEVVGDAGILVPPGDAEAFADAVQKVCDDCGLRETLIERGLERIQRFRWTDSAAKMLELLRGCIEAPRGTAAVSEE